VIVGFFGLMSLLQLPAIFAPGKGGVGLVVFAIAFECLIIWLTIRAVGSATISATERGVRYRNVARDRWWTWSELDSFEARDDHVGIMAYRRRVLFVKQGDGALRKLDAINARPGLSPNPIDGVAERLNSFLRTARG
jgi:hypothetical protein